MFYLNHGSCVCMYIIIFFNECCMQTYFLETPLLSAQVWDKYTTWVLAIGYSQAILECSKPWKLDSSAWALDLQNLFQLKVIVLFITLYLCYPVCS